ncbi:MAG: helix-turn-helix transcriptional regulator [Chloroflexi bacterium]|nr:helix-turn-helix transcriptional regulator [Chloroflexota bacterium]OJV93994.1 MAG: hypothetical protein BGO39_18335 [Chloroflexi bacterium 54-19]
MKQPPVSKQYPHPITRRLKELGKTQQWLAAQIGVSQSEISCFVNRKRKLFRNSTKAHLIVDALGIDFNYLRKY